jgi:hypothetical protein
MKKFTGFLAFALLLAFGPLTAATFAGDPPTPTMPSPTDEPKQPGGPKADDNKDEKKDDKGGK